MKIDRFEIYKKIRKRWLRNPKNIIYHNKRKSRQQEKLDLSKEYE